MVLRALVLAALEGSGSGPRASPGGGWLPFVEGLGFSQEGLGLGFRVLGVEV